MVIDPQALAYVESFLSPQRQEKFHSVLSQRTRHFTVATEDVYQLHNTSAVIRSCDVFGVQDVHPFNTIRNPVDPHLHNFHKLNTLRNCDLLI